MKYMLLFCFFIFTINTYSQSKKLKNIYSENNKIGIGTKYPDALLTVKGNIHTQEVMVDLNGAVTPDYVFETYYTSFSGLNPTYRFLSLKEIETFIKKNHHLPKIPSAKDFCWRKLKN